MVVAVEALSLCRHALLCRSSLLLPLSLPRTWTGIVIFAWPVFKSSMYAAEDDHQPLRVTESLARRSETDEKKDAFFSGGVEEDAELAAAASATFFTEPAAAAPAAAAVPGAAPPLCPPGPEPPEAPTIGGRIRERRREKRERESCEAREMWRQRKRERVFFLFSLFHFSGDRKRSSKSSRFSSRALFLSSLSRVGMSDRRGDHSAASERGAEAAATSAEQALERETVEASSSLPWSWNSSSSYTTVWYRRIYCSTI